MPSSYSIGNLISKIIYFKRIEESAKAMNMIFPFDIHLALTLSMAMYFLACDLRKYCKAELEGMQIPSWLYTF